MKFTLITVALQALEIRMDHFESSVKQEFERAERNAEARLNLLLIALGHEARIKKLEEERHQ